MSKPRQSAIVALAIIAVLAALGASSCRKGYSGEVEPVAIGSAPLESSALIYVAERQGFFARNGLNVTIREYATGAASLTGLVNGEVDIAVPAEYALVGRAFQKDSIRAIASIDKVQYFFIVGRKDRGIEKTSDLKGKKVGVVTRTIAEFYLGRFLELHGMDAKKVSTVNIDIARSVDAIMGPGIDAIVSRPPYVSGIKEALGANAVVWPAQSSQALYAVLIGRNNWIAEHPGQVKRLLRSLMQAEEYVVRYPAEAKAIVRERLKVDDAYVDSVWSENQFSLTLDQSLISAMEDEARWMIANNLTKETQVPDFLDHIYEDGLKVVKPRAVSIIR